MMALNKFMHRRNHYKNNRPDFAKLGGKYPEFQQFLSFTEKGKPLLDFKDPEALRALTCTLLKEDFDLDLDIPLDHIVPTVPLRLNYIHWLEDLLEGMLTKEDIWCIDIGCGTSCIYPLLGAKMNGWHFWGLEVDPLALQYARDNVERNGLGDHIQVIDNPGQSLFLDMLHASPGRRFHFTMCNPPFFGNLMEAQGFLSSRGPGRADPSSVSTADEGEMIVEGGEVEFVKRMIQESKMVKHRVLWFTSMLGKKSSMGRIVAELKKEKVPAWTTTEFCQGKTMRWGVGWSYQKEMKKKHSPQRKRTKDKPPLSINIPSVFITRMASKLDLTSSPHQKTDLSLGRQEKVQVVAMAMEQLMKSLKMSVTKQASTKWNPKFTLIANQNTWSHQRRKRRQAKRKVKDEGGARAIKKIQTTSQNPTTLETVMSSLNPASTTTAQDIPLSGCHRDITMTTEDGIEAKVCVSQESSVLGIVRAGPGRESQFEQLESNCMLCCHRNVEMVRNMGVRCYSTKEEQCQETMGSRSTAKINVRCHGDKAIQNKCPTNMDTLVVCENTFDRHLPGGRPNSFSEHCIEIDCNNGTTSCKRGKEACGPRNHENDNEGKNLVKQPGCLDPNANAACGTAVEPLLAEKAKSLKCVSWRESDSEPENKKMKLDGDLQQGRDMDAQCQRSANVKDNSKDVTDNVESTKICDKNILQGGCVAERGTCSGSWGEPTKHVHSVICMSSSDPGSGSDAERGPLLECVLEVKVVTKGAIEVSLSCAGSQSREVLHQVAQYVKNYITREIKGSQ